MFYLSSAFGNPFTDIVTSALIQGKHESAKLCIVEQTVALASDVCSKISEPGQQYIAGKKHELILQKLQAKMVPESSIADHLAYISSFDIRDIPKTKESSEVVLALGEALRKIPDKVRKNFSSLCLHCVKAGGHPNECPSTLQDVVSDLPVARKGYSY